MKIFYFLSAFLLVTSWGFANDTVQSIAFIKGVPVVEKGESLSLQVKFAVPLENKEIVCEWIDSKERLCGSQKIVVEKKKTSISVTFKLENPIGYLHKIQFVVDGVRQIIQHEFQVRYPYKKWIDYKASVWAFYDPAFGDLLRDAGLNSSIGGQKNVTSQDFEFYCDNIAYEVFAYYHKRRHEHQAMKELWEVKPDTVVLHHRRPSLTDESTFDKVRERLWPVIDDAKDYRPLFYNIADEIGIADQSAVSDLDWEYSNRTAWKEWLQKKYITITALNLQWGTDFESWSAVRAYFPSTHKIYDQLHLKNLLPKSYRSIEELQKTFQTDIDSYEDFVEVFAKIRNHDAGMTAKGLETRFNSIEKFNTHFKSKCIDFVEAEKFVSAYESWVGEQDASDTKGWNLSWWCDWRDYMDTYMAVGLGKARAIGKEKDPDGIFGITGTHHPGVFSGHNYSKLMKELDYIMPYNIGESFELMRGLDPSYLFMHPT